MPSSDGIFLQYFRTVFRTVAESWEKQNSNGTIDTVSGRKYIYK